MAKDGEDLLVRALRRAHHDVTGDGGASQNHHQQLEQKFENGQATDGEGNEAT